MGLRATALFARLQPTAPGEDDARSFVQIRTAQFARMMFFCVIGLLVGVNLMYELYPVTRPARAMSINYFAAGGLALLVWAWWVCRRNRPLSERMLLGIDIAAMGIMGVAFSASGILADDQEINVYSSYMWMSYAVFIRSLVIPSSGRQTLALSTLAMAPAMVSAAVVDVAIPTVPLLAGMLIFCAAIIAVATIGSHIVYGLRAQVREAMQLGQYTIVDKIGEGGMGTVYRARHAMLRRPTAVKLLKPELVTQASLTRFEREVQATSELAHPHTVAIYDYGRSPDGLFYYAMELLDGVDLETLVRRSGPQPWQRVVHILRQVCGALEEAHSRGLVHRDIKPGNVILCERGGIPDFVKVVDFGLVKELETDVESTGSLIAGTPAYLAPELLTSPDKVGPASDLYAVGALAYFLLTGKLVFEADSVIQICVHHARSKPVPPSERAGISLPGALEQLVLRCLAKEPDDRPASAAELRNELTRVTSSDPWTELRARAAMEEFEARHGADVHRLSPSSLATMTVDLRSRGDLDLGTLDTRPGD